MYLNATATSEEPLDLTQTDEIPSLLESAADLGIPYRQPVRVRSRLALVNGLRLHYLEWGEAGAPEILFLHGGFHTAHIWDLTALALQHRYHLYALDMRGHGDSEWARDRSYGFRAFAADAQAFMATVGLDRPVVVGHSLGAITIMRLLATTPQLGRGLVFVDMSPHFSPGRAGNQRLRERLNFDRNFETIEAYVEQAAAREPHRPRTHIERTARYHLIQRPGGAYVMKTDPGLFRFPGGGNAPRQRAFPMLLTPESAAAIDAPVLVVRGEHSRVLRAQDGPEFAAMFPRGRFVTVPGCGHNVHTQNTPGFLDVLTPFLDEVSSPLQSPK
jgi:pimeloyl-ACP methyl ester carboxylesterase